MTIIARTLAVLSLILASLLVSGGDASANHAWGTYHWARNTAVFTLQLGSNVDSNWASRLAKTSYDWNHPELAAKRNGTASDLDNEPWTGATVIQTAVVAGTTDGRKCRPSAGTTQVCNARYGANGWLGLAQIWISNGHITQGTAKMNDTYFNTSTYSSAAEKQHVMCQEVAHTFGLGHQSENGSSQNSCMDYFSNTGANAADLRSTEPNYHDFEQLATIYAHIDSYNSYTSGAPKTPSRAATAPGFADDGTPIGASKDKGRYYVTDLPNGMRIVTHITWAD